MIFENIKHITNKDSFLELTNIYVRLVEVTAERNKMVVQDSDFVSKIVLEEICDMGLISSKDDITLLQNILKDRFYHFISCISFYLNNKTLFDKTIKLLNNKERYIIQQSASKSKKPTFVDFFSGAGGLSCGFTQAGLRVILANDFEDVCVRTYRFNHPEIKTDYVLQEDIRKIVDNINSYIPEEADVVVGGPPCQGFSSANQQRIIDDPRNELYKYFIKAVSQILPKFVIMENVRGMIKVADQVVEDYENIRVSKNGVEFSYKVGYMLLNSVDFGVAQSRERLIYIAIRNDICMNKHISPTSIFEEIKEANKRNSVYSLSEALFAIPKLDAPRIKNTNEIDSDISGKKIDYNKFVGNENEYLRLINSNRIIPYLFNHKARFVNDVNYEIYRLLNQGDDASDSKIADIMPYTHRLHCFKDKYFKLIADKPSRTITAHLRMDCHSHIHPFQIRAITPREAARCQSFPDDYLFLGAYLKTYMQIGNAVPCLMAKGIANTIKRYL